MSADRSSQMPDGLNGGAPRPRSDRDTPLEVTHILQVHERLRGAYYNRPEVLRKIAKAIIGRIKPR